MFETVVPETVVKRSRTLYYLVLPLSLISHGVAIGVVLATNIWNVEFPKSSPKMYMTYSLVEPPPPPPPPAPKKEIQIVKLPDVKMPLVAPTVIPDLIPVVVETPPEPQPEVVAEKGVEGGVEGGIEGGELGGIVGGIITNMKPKPQPLPEVVEIKRDDPLPMGSVSQEFPKYPEYARTRGWEDTLVVRYIIGKNGKVKEVTVVKPPSREEFARAALEAIRYWRFQPFRDPANGEIKEVQHELTVEFKISRRAPSR